MLYIYNTIYQLTLSTHSTPHTSVIDDFMRKCMYLMQMIAIKRFRFQERVVLVNGITILSYAVLLSLIHVTIYSESQSSHTPVYMKYVSPSDYRL